MDGLVFGVSDFVAVFNQTIEYAYPNVTIRGELANFRVSKNRWVYFDLKDDLASVRFFGTVYNLPGPLEDGMMLEVQGAPRLHPQFGFSVNVQTIRPVGEGSIKKAFNLLQAKLTAEGLFDESRKRILPYPPHTIGLITSKESAAYADFTKILNQRWRGISVNFIDVQVQGEAAVGQIVAALEYFNQLAVPPEVIVLIRGGGSADDLAVFNTEQVVRAVAASRVPSLVAIGHEIDTSLAELAADKRASTPSNAAEIMVPDRRDTLNRMSEWRAQLAGIIEDKIAQEKDGLQSQAIGLEQFLSIKLEQSKQDLAERLRLVNLLSPQSAMQRGYAVVRRDNKLVSSVKQAKVNDIVTIELKDGVLGAQIKAINGKKS